MHRRVRSARKVSIAVLFLAFPLCAWSLVAYETAFPILAFVLQLLLCIFVGTEAFGPVASDRSRINRVVARVSLVPLSVIVVGMAYYFSVGLLP